MTDLNERLRGIDRLSPPDLWETARVKAQAGVHVPDLSTRRRLAIIAASLAIGVVGLAVVMIAFRSSREATPATVQWQSGEIDALGLTFQYPSTWHLQPFDEQVGHVGFTGAVVSNVGEDLHHPDQGPNSFTTAWDLSELSRSGVVVSIERVDAIGYPPKPDSEFPVSLADAKQLDQTGHSGDTEGLWLQFWLNGKLMGARVYFGPNASQEDRRLAADVVASIRPVTGTNPSVQAQPTHINGVPFDVCRPMSIPGRFGGGIDTLWVFERAPEQGCEGYEGFQYVAVGTSDSVVGLSNEIHDVGQNVTSLWPYAAFDIDRNGVDEIAVGIGGSESKRRASIILFHVGVIPGDSGRLGIEQVTLSCGQVCIQRSPWIDLGQFQDVHLGADCDPNGTQSQGITLWSAEAGLLKARLWVLDGSALRATTDTFERSGEASVSLPDGTIDLCGSPVHWPAEFPNYPPEDIAP